MATLVCQIRVYGGKSHKFNNSIVPNCMQSGLNFEA